MKLMLYAKIYARSSLLSDFLRRAEAVLALEQFRSLEMRKEAIQKQKWITETVWEEQDP